MEQFRQVGGVLGSLKAQMVFKDEIQINQRQCCLLVDACNLAFEVVAEEMRQYLRFEERFTKWNALESPLRELYRVFKEGEHYVRQCLETKDWWAKAISLSQNCDCIDFHLHNLLWCIFVVLEAIENVGEISGCDQEVIQKKRLVFMKKYEQEWMDPHLFQHKFGKKYLVSQDISSRLDSVRKEDHWILSEMTSERRNSGSMPLAKQENQLAELLLAPKGKLFPSSVLVRSKDYQVRRRLGSGGPYKEVQWMGESFAVGHFFGDIEPLKQEISLVSSLRHPNVMHIMYAFSDEERRELFLVMELMSKDLSSYIKEICSTKRRLPFPLLVAVDIMLQIARGMEYLHSCGMHHGDLNPSNILVKPRNSNPDGYLHVKIQGIGLPSLKKLRASTNQTATDSCIWYAPEVLSEQEQSTEPSVSKCTEKADVYSFAMICFEVLTGKIPFEDDHLQGDCGQPDLPAPPVDYFDLEAKLSKNFTTWATAEALSVSEVPFQMFAYRVMERERTNLNFRERSSESGSEGATSICGDENGFNLMSQEDPFSAPVGSLKSPSSPQELILPFSPESQKKSLFGCGSSFEKPEASSVLPEDQFWCSEFPRRKKARQACSCSCNCFPIAISGFRITQEGEVGKMDTHVGDAGTPVEGTGLQADDSGLKDSKSSESSDRQHQDKILEKCVEGCEKDETEKHKDGSDTTGPQNKDKIRELQQRIDSDVEPEKTQEGEAGDSMASIESPLSLKAEKTTNEETLQAEQDGKTLNLEDVPVECQNQQNAKRIIDDLRNKIEQLKAANSKLQNEIDESSTTLRNTNLEVDSWNKALKSKEGADKYMSPAYALQTLSSQNVLHDIEETESLISQPVNLLPEQQDQSQLEAQKSELEREFKELLEQSNQSQKEIDYLQDRHNELIEMIETAKTAHKEKEDGIRRDIGNCEEERGVIERCIRTWSDRMLILEEECRQMKETAEPVIYSMNDMFLRLQSEVMEWFGNIQLRLSDCRNRLQMEKAELALHHENQGLEIENNKIGKELDLLINESNELRAELEDEERVNRMLAILFSRNDDSEVQEGGLGDVVASGDLGQSEEAETDKEMLQTLQDKKGLNLEDVAITSEKQQGSRKIMDVLRSEIEQLKAENMRLQIGIDNMSNMVADTNLEVDNLNKALKAVEGAGEFIRPVGSLQSLSAQDVLHETDEAETLMNQPEASLFQEQQDQSQLGAQNSDLEKEIQEMQKQRSLNEKEIDKLRVYGNALIEMIETAKTAHGEKIEGTLRDIENCEQECKWIQRCSDRAGTLEEEWRQMKEMTMPTINLLLDRLLSLKLEVEERFRNMQMRLSACTEELRKQKAKLMAVHHENQECTTMNHKMERELQSMGTAFLGTLDEMKKSGQGLHDTERVKILEDVAMSEMMLEELKMEIKDVNKRMSALKTEKKDDLGLLPLQLEQHMKECRTLSQLIHRRHSIWERLREMFRKGKL
ncbi:putative myosin heavy chain, striated muscle [Cocos nucifera]|uniref:Putative myosin heavy chain, striated muscle n=1 Tax=Cocos nucifera TaxID=13894 RepID=A0A8K0I3H3_COCNU|nr:putative myosin heavy chain, striated muscle [Cocos nucifera]